jgi:hypothetical protein
MWIRNKYLALQNQCDIFGNGAADKNLGKFLTFRGELCAQKFPGHHLKVKPPWEIIGRNLLGQISTLT